MSLVVCSFGRNVLRPALIAFTVVGLFHATVSRADRESDLLAKLNTLQNAAHSSAPSPCQPVPQDWVRPLYRGLKHITFYLHFPGDLRTALECRGHEHDCAVSHGDRQAAHFDEYVEKETQRLQLLNAHFPPALFPDNIERLSQQTIQHAFIGLLPRNSACTPPVIDIVDPDTLNPPSLAANNNETLNYVLTLTFISDTMPQIVVLSVKGRRAGFPAYEQQPEYITALPLMPNNSDLNNTALSVLHSTLSGSFRAAPQPVE